MLIRSNNPEELAKEMFWLAWQACGGPVGMGVFQDRKGATREEVWENITTAGDYPFRPAREGNRIHADYVFGRMVKLSLAVTEEGVEVDTDRTLRADYQSWCAVYPTMLHLVESARRNLDQDLTRSNPV